METGKMRLLPDYLIENDSNVNESRDKSKVLHFDYGTNGSLVRNQNPLDSGDYLHTGRNVNLAVDDDWDQDYTLEVLYIGSVNILNFRGDNKTVSNTSITVSRTRLTYRYWTSQVNIDIDRYMTDPDSDGYTSLTVVREGNYVRFYQYNRQIYGLAVSNRFTSKAVTALSGSYNIKRFSLSMGVALPRELHYDKVERYTSRGAANIKLINLNEDVYDSSVFDTRMVKDVYSYTQYIFVIYNNGDVDAAYRPRGLDSGESIRNVSYDYETGTLSMGLTVDGATKGFSFKPEIISAETKAIPEGKGVLSQEGVHKPLQFGEGFNVSDYEGDDVRLALPSEIQPVVKETPSIVTSTDNASGLLDYRKRLLMLRRIVPGDGFHPKLNQRTETGEEKWETLMYETNVTTMRYFDYIDGKWIIKKGKYYLKGDYPIYRNDRRTHSFRIKVGNATIFSRTTATEYLENAYVCSDIAFEKVIYILEDGEITVEEFTPDFGGLSVTNISVLISKIEFFKI